MKMNNRSPKPRHSKYKVSQSNAVYKNEWKQTN